MKFELDEKEGAAAKAFASQHRHADKYFGAIGGHLSYTIVGTSIGQLVSICCGACDVSELLTDAESL